MFTCLYDCKLRGVRLDNVDDFDVATSLYLNDLCYVKGSGYNHASSCTMAPCISPRSCGTSCHGALVRSLAGNASRTVQKENRPHEKRGVPSCVGSRGTEGRC